MSKLLILQKNIFTSKSIDKDDKQIKLKKFLTRRGFKLKEIVKFERKRSGLDYSTWDLAMS